MNGQSFLTILSVLQCPNVQSATLVQGQESLKDLWRKDVRKYQTRLFRTACLGNGPVLRKITRKMEENAFIFIKLMTMLLTTAIN